MSKKTIVTIGICARNAENTIKEAIESVFDQEFPKECMELILVDDGSEDSTLSIMRHYASKSKISCRIFGGVRLGLSKARNMVVDNANGDYIVWVDSDIILPKDHVRKQVDFMEKHPKVGIAGARFYGFPEKALLVQLQNLEWIAINKLAQRDGTLDMPFAVCGGSVYRTKAIREIGGFDDQIMGAGEDEDLELRANSAGWSIHKGTDAFFYERRKKTWIAIWRQFSWYGYGAHFLMHQKKRNINPSQLLDALSLSSIAYQLTGRKVAFMLPLQYYFKRIAWYFGFLKAHLQGYGHNSYPESSQKTLHSSDKSKLFIRPHT